LESLPRGEPTRGNQEIAARHYEIPHSERTAVSVNTLLEWALWYVPIPEFIAYLNTEAHLLGRPISDKTRIAGRFDIDLRYDTCTIAKPLFTDVPRGPGGATCADYSSYHSLADALREQLGLRLESAKGAVELRLDNRTRAPLSIYFADTTLGSIPWPSGADPR